MDFTRKFNIGTNLKAKTGSLENLSFTFSVHLRSFYI